MLPNRDRSTSSRSSARRGIVLLEVMFAVVVLSAGLVNVIAAMRSAMRLESVAADVTIAASLLDETLARVRLLPDLEAGLSSDNFDAPHEHIAWELEVTPLPGEAEGGGELFHVVATVRWVSFGDDRTVQAATLAWKHGELVDDVEGGEGVDGGI